jgi:hypothetical protein
MITMYERGTSGTSSEDVESERRIFSKTVPGSAARASNCGPARTHFTFSSSSLTSHQPPFSTCRAADRRCSRKRI